jgi:aquaporin Z
VGCDGEHSYDFKVGDGFTSGEAFLAEMMVTSTLVMSALMVGEIPDSKLVQVGVVAMALFAGAHSVGYISGACFNPAIGIAANTTDSIKRGVHYMEHIWIYLLAPSLGGVIAAIIHLIYRPALANSDKVGYENLHANPS